MATYDLVVIGSGPAGEKGAAQAAYFGRRVAIVERAAQLGGTCVHTGTLPSKTLRETALFLSGHRQRTLYGVHVALQSDLTVPGLMCRQEPVRASEEARIDKNLERHGIELIHGAASFVDEHTIRIDASMDGRRGRTIEGGGARTITS